jgi:hypothetical protein
MEGGEADRKAGEVKHLPEIQIPTNLRERRRKK